jgi:hypothetical protein
MSCRSDYEDRMPEADRLVKSEGPGVKASWKKTTETRGVAFTEPLGSPPWAKSWSRGETRNPTVYELTATRSDDHPWEITLRAQKPERIAADLPAWVIHQAAAWLKEQGIE